MSDSLPGDRSGEPPSREPDIKPFTYLLNAMEVAAWAEKPSERGYEVKRKAVFDYVREALRAARGGSPPNTNSPEISTPLVVGGSPAGEPDEAAVTLLREELVVTIQKSLPAGAHLLVAEFEAAVRAAPVAHGVQQPRSRQHLGGGGPAEDPTDAEIETLWAWMNGEDDGRVWTQGDARRALLAVRAAASGSARPPEPSEAAVAAAVEAYRRNARGQYDAHSVELDARQMWSAALQSAYAIDFRGPGAADPLRVAAQALLDALEPLADFYLSEPTQIARRSLRAALSSGAADPPESAGATTEAALREAMQAVILAHDEAMPRAGDGSGCHCNLCAKYRVWLSGALASAPPPERHHA